VDQQPGSTHEARSVVELVRAEAGPPSCSHRDALAEIVPALKTRASASARLRSSNWERNKWRTSRIARPSRT
jgi:hypothetical protein